MHTTSNHIGHVDVKTLTATQRTILAAMAAGRFDEVNAIYSDPERTRPSLELMRQLADLGLVTLLEGSDGLWQAGMWGASLTCLGLNTAYRSAGGEFGSHIECGEWDARGRCSGCRTQRPLDARAYQDYLEAIGPTAAMWQRSGPQLFCAEHGYVRRDDVNTQKVCRLPGTSMHDGGLFRV